MFINRCFELRQRGSGRRELALSIKLSNAGFAQAMIRFGRGARGQSLSGTLRRVLPSLVEGGRDLSESVFGLGDDLSGAGDSDLRVSQFLSCLIAPGEDRSQLTACGRTVAVYRFA
jgi:hypothetical protein